MALGKNSNCVLDYFSQQVPNDSVDEIEIKIDELYSLCDDPMLAPVKLVNEHLQFSDNDSLKHYFVDNSGFIVVGVLGVQGCGKSSILNILANRLDSVVGPIDIPFPVETVESLELGRPQTIGIDFYITQDRVILLDTQPLLSWALTDKYIRTSKINFGSDLGEISKISKNPGKWIPDYYSEMSSIQVVAFLFSVCHVVVLVQDNLSNADLLCLVDRAAGMKPVITVADLLLPRQPTGHHQAEEPKPVPASACRGRRARSLDPLCRGEMESGEGFQKSGPVTSETAASQRQSPARGEEASTKTSTHTLIDRLQNLSDYSAGMIMVYNGAPAGVFLNPCVIQRLGAYRRMLKHFFVCRARLSSLSRLFPRILRRHLASQRGQLSGDQRQSNSPPALTTTNSQLDEKQAPEGIKKLSYQSSQLLTPETAASSSGFQANKLCDPGIASLVDDVSGLALSPEQFYTASSLPQLEGDSQPRLAEGVSSQQALASEEEEIVGDSCSLLAAEAASWTSLLASDEEGASSPAVRTADPQAYRPSLTERFFEEEVEGQADGEAVTLEMSEMSRRASHLRKQHLEPIKRLSRPRLFVLPSVNEAGHAPYGCPTYLECAYRLQEAVFSSYRQHMAPELTEKLWLEYARRTWDSISVSPLLHEYHRLLSGNG